MSALRQAALLTAVFVAVLIGAGLLALSELQREFNKRVKSELDVRFAVIASDINDNGFNTERYPSTGLETVLFLKEGEKSGIREFQRTGFFDHIGHRRGRRDHDDWDDHGDWLYLAGPVENGRLIVGTNLGRREIFEEIALQTFGFVGFLSALTAIALGLWFGFRNQRRISTISSVLDQVADGDLNARIDTPRHRDDLDALAHRVDHTTERLDILLRQTRDFSANIAHDLKTPLARLRIRLESALIAETDHGDSADEIGAALEQADKVIAIFDAFLRIAKLESGATKANFTKVDLAEIAHEVFSTYAPVIEDSERTLAADIKGPCAVEGDRVLLIQMVANMIENALRHTPEGTSLRLIAKEGILGLADNGPGIPEHELDKVTLPLYRLEKSRTTEGAGLGLSLVKTIAEVHGAELILSKDPATGTGLFIRAYFG